MLQGGGGVTYNGLNSINSLLGRDLAVGITQGSPSCPLFPGQLEI